MLFFFYIRDLGIAIFFSIFEIGVMFIFFIFSNIKLPCQKLFAQILKCNSMILMVVYHREEEHSISSLSSVEDEKKTQQDFANKEKRYLIKTL